MLKLISKEYFFLFIFFISLVLFDNDINSKVIIGLVLLSLFRFDLKALKFNAKKNYPVLIFFTLILISLFYSSNLTSGLKSIKRLTIIPATLLLFMNFYQIKIKTKPLAFIYIITILIATCYSHYNVISLFIANNENSLHHFFNLNYSYKALGNTINLHTTYYSIYILVAIIFLLKLIKTKEIKSYIKTISILLFLYFSFFIIQLSSRISIIILYFITIINILTYLYRSKKLLKGIFITVIFHLVGFIFIMNVGTTKYRFQHLFGFTYYNGYTVNDTNHKTKLWSAAINSNHNILFGNGIGDVQNSLNEQYFKNGMKKPLKDNYNSHNQYIEYFIGIGVIGLSWFTYMLFYYFKLFIKNKNFIGIQFIIILSISSFTECIWNRHHGIVFIVFWLFLLTNNYSLSDNSFLAKPKLAKTTSININII